MEQSIKNLFCSRPLKLALWLILSLALSFILFREFWANLSDIFSPSSIINQNQAAPWGALLLCFIFLVVKRKEVYRQMKGSDNLFPFFKGGLRGIFPFGKENASFWVSLSIGLALVIASIFFPADSAFLLFRVILSSLGVFMILFGWGAAIPAILTLLYGFVLAFPLLIERFADAPYAQTVIYPLMHLLLPLGFPLQNDGQWLNLVSAGGQNISVEVISGCAGPSTMALFIALFVLMMLDTPLPPLKAIVTFLLGVAGTWLQSFLRILILMLAGYFFGESALWTAHSWTIYILFPLWYLLFAYLYFRQVRRKSIIRANAST